MIKVAIVGFGNVGKYALDAVQEATDMKLAGIVSKHLSENKPVELSDINVVDDVDKLGKVDVAILATATRKVEENAIKLLKKGINTVDSFDIHTNIFELKTSLDKVAKENNAVSVISAGWDPGSDSVVRALMQAIVPKGITYTNFGPGMSMGHSVVAKSKTGVEDALSMTMPLGDGIHRRIVYLQMKKGADFDLACKEIKADDYFAHDETVFVKVDNVNDVLDYGHGVHLTRKGVSGKTHNQLMEFNMKINNPALTSQIMVAYARATTKMPAGCYTTIEIPVIKLLQGSDEENIRKLV